MNDPTRALVLDLVEWVAQAPRPYREVMDAWRTSCPRLTIWEDARDEGLVQTYRDAAGTTFVVASTEGRSLLESHGRM